MIKEQLIKELEKQHRLEFDKTKHNQTIRLKKIRTCLKYIDSIEFYN